MYHKKIWILLVYMLIFPMLTACDANELDREAYVVTIGIDEGVSNKFRITFQFPVFKGNASSEVGQGQSNGGRNSDYATYTVDAPSFFEAVNMANTSTPRELNFMHTKYLVFSEAAAKEGIMGNLVAPMLRYREIRRNLKVIVAKGLAQDFLEQQKPFFGALLTKNQEGQIDMHKITGYYPNTTLSNLYNGMKSTYRQPIAILGAVNSDNNFRKKGEKWQESPEHIGYVAGAIPKTGGDKIELMGSMIGNGGKIVGELDGGETRFLLMVRGELHNCFFTIKDPKMPDLPVVFYLRQSKKPLIKVTFKRGKPVIYLKLFLEGDIAAIQSRINYERPENKEALERAFEEIAKNSLDKVIEKCKELDSDVFGFGAIAVRSFLTIQEWEDYNWNSHFKDAIIITEVEFKIKRTGAMISSSPIITSGGTEE